MGKEYRYGKVIRWGQYAIPAGFAILLAGLWAVVGLGLLSSRFLSFLPDVSLLLELSIMSCVVLLGGGLEWYLCYRLAGVRVSLDQEAIVYRNRAGMKRIPFDSISRFVFPVFRFGWTKITSKQHTIRLTAALEHLPDFLLELKAALDERGLSDCYDRREFFRFMKKAVHADQPARPWQTSLPSQIPYSLSETQGRVAPTSGQEHRSKAGTH